MTQSRVRDHGCAWGGVATGDIYSMSEGILTGKVYGSDFMCFSPCALFYGPS